MTRRRRNLYSYRKVSYVVSATRTAVTTAFSAFATRTTRTVSVTARHASFAIVAVGTFSARAAFWFGPAFRLFLQCAH